MKRGTPGKLILMLLILALAIPLSVYAEQLQIYPDDLENLVIRQHEHTWSEWRTVQAAGCESGGLEERVCSGCGETEQRRTEAAGHRPQTVSGYAATCETAGKTDGSVCSVCGAVLKAQQDIPATGHSPQTVAGYAATCEAAGKTDGSVCSVCGAVLTAQQDIPATGHSPQTIAGYAATCETAGKTDGSVCSVCGAVLTAQQDIPASGHSPQTIAGYAATCEAAGKTDGSVCSVCGTVLAAQQDIPATGHSWDNGMVTTAATCTQEGIRTFTCANCGATRTETIPKAEHKPEKIPAVAETCEKPGKTEGKKCSTCGEILEKQQEIPAKGHDWGPWKEGSEPTCETKGKDYSVCANCGQTRYRDIREALGHDWDEGVVTKGSGYLEDGEILYTCRRDPSHTKTEKIADESSSVSAFMNIVRFGNPPKDPSTVSGDPLKLEKDISDTEIPFEGTGAVLAVEVSGGVPPYSYKWVCTHNIKGEDVYEYVGGDEPELPVYEPGVYYCNVTDSQKTTYLSSASVYVYHPLRIWYQPYNANLQIGDQISFGVEGGVPPYTYEWQTVGESGAVQIPDAPNENCIFPDELNLEAGTSVICVVTDKLGHKIETEPGHVYSAEPLEAYCTEPLFLREGEKAEFGVWGKGGVPPYTAVWMDSVGNELPVEEREDGGFYMTCTSNGGYASFRCVLIDSMDRKTPACYTGYDYRQLTITQQPQGGTLPHGGGEHTMTIGVADGVEPYKFTLFSPVGDNQYQEGNFSECSFTVTEPGWYDAYIEDAEGNYAYSDTAILNGYDTVHIENYTDYELIMEPQGFATLSVTAEGGEEPYSYKWKLEEHGPYDPELFRKTKLENAPSIQVYEPGAVYSCTVTDKNGDKAYAELMRVEYAGAIWILQQPEDIRLECSPNDEYSISLDCLAISINNDFSYQWYVRDMYGRSFPVTIERGSYGGNHYERTGNSKQVGGRYFCRIHDGTTGEEKDTDRAFVSVGMELKGVKQTNLDDRNVSLDFDYDGGTPPYHVEVQKWFEGGTITESSEWVDSISPYTFKGAAVQYKYSGGKEEVSYQIFIRDSMGRYITNLYTCTDPDPGVPAKVTFGH